MNKTLTAAGIAATLLFAGCASNRGSDTGNGRIYIGAGALASRLAPDTDAVPGVEVDESASGGANVLLGYDLNDRFSIEGNYARLGEATLSPDGAIDYDVAGISALVYGFSGAERRARREGLSGFGRVGVGKLDNASDVEFEQVNDFNLLIGLGAEYGLTNGLGIRGELVAHDKDVAYGQLALVYRFGEPANTRRRQASSEPAAKPEAAPRNVPEAAATPLPVPTPPVATRPEPVIPDADPAQVELIDQAGLDDSDQDGVADALDTCADTAAGLPVDTAGCDLYDGAVEGISFEVGSETLTGDALQVLDGVVGTLNDYPTARMAIETHTDNTGTAANNLQLSRRRAVSVVSYLVGQGIAGDRLVPRAFGESRPSVPNTSVEGRAANRRVEMRFVP